MQQLQPNTLLQGGRYKIIETLGQGGFGITYLAIQAGLDRKVAVKEFFMKELCNRDETTSHVILGAEGSRETVNRFREKFLKEARNIARLNHPNIVGIIDVFEENGTAYYVMEYAENGSLADKVKREGYLSESVATRYILQVAEALDYIHQQKMNHLDVKPANIMLNEKDEAVLIDFGLSKQYDATTGNQTSTTPVGISEGYAPMEQYIQGGVGAFSPETDIYAIGATFYKLLTGITPPNASLVSNEGLSQDELTAKGISQMAINVIMKAMEGRKKDRMNSVRSFIKGLDAPGSSTTYDSPQDDESTLFTPEMQHAQDERKHKEQTKATKEKAEAEAREKLEEKHKAGDESVTMRKDEMKVRKTERTSSKNMWKWTVFGVVIIAAIIIGVSFMISVNGNYSQEGNTVQNTKNAYYSDGVLHVGAVTYSMVKVQGGKFNMGATSEMKNAWEHEKPIHQVTLTNDYYIGMTEVTQELWVAVMDYNPSEFKGANKPVERVSWDTCNTFISKLNSMTGKNFRLPTEAEWEFAARGGNISNHYQYSGSNNLDDVAWYNANSGSSTHDVATKQPNELGIYDMSGNVWEWCSDWYGSYSSSSQNNPTGPSSGSMHVSRGGCWDYDAEGCHSSGRVCGVVADGGYYLGLRLAISE